ncbi:SusC/RagA family TonB-linked outer membrane protein [uncultured Chitinophaga sp.]|uniref:SusC/RagA family TonB-linked outer membrane protein n=1 Tax=uncultured Chitinophaga sp. TaxID=339340 RepID=UPI0025F169F0|nr:SusC/RagA family TonB-linked outer membrane protein [uncultured Chitinophaga sp.]
MRLIAVILCALAMQVRAQSMAQTITYTGKSVALQTVFASIKTQTGYKFFYRNEDLAGLPAVTVQLKNATLEKAMQQVLAGQPLDYSIEGKTVFVNRIPQVEGVAVAVQGGTGEVRGAITDGKGMRLPGITILAKVSRLITVSNDAGEFVLPGVAGNDTLLFSSINYEALTLPVSFTSHLAVVLRPRITALSTVTVYNSGYQQVSKERATGAFELVDMKVFQNRVVTNDIMTRLDGQVPGLTVMPGKFEQAKSRNGVTTNKVVVRGITTVNGVSEPVYVVNGVIVSDFSNVNPQDIEDITVLKDASAAAIYGARAANGVIVVHTKEGKKKQSLTINYSGNYAYQGKPDFDYLPLMNSKQYIQAARETFAPEVYPYETFAYRFMSPHDKILYNEYRGVISGATANSQLDSLSGINNRSQITDLFYRNAMQTNHTISAAGGTDNYSFYASLGYTGNQSVTPGQRDNTYRFNLTQNMNIGKRVAISLNTSLINNLTSANGGQQAGITFLPYQLFKDAAGNEINMTSLMGQNDSIRADYQARSRVNLDYFPLQDRQYSSMKTNNLFMNVTADVNVKLWKGLSYSGVFGYVKNPGTNEYYNDHQSYSQRNQLVNFTIAPTVNSVPQYLIPSTGGEYTTMHTEQRNWTVRNQLVYNASPRMGKDRVSVQVGQEAQHNFSSNKTTTLLGYERDLGTYALIDYVTLSKPIFGTVPGFAMLNSRPYNVSQNLDRFSSYFALASYTYDGKYTLDGSWRRDHSNLFGSDISAQNKPSYSIGAKWQISNEAFMMPVTWIDELAVRGSYGITGNTPFGGGTSSDILVALPQAQSGGVAGDALRVDRIANPKLSWEATRTINLGIDFGFLNRRISGGLNFYHKNTSDLLGNLRLNRFSGFDITYGNLGEMENKGIELGLRSTNLQLGDFSWTSSLAIAHNSNKLKSLGVTTATSYSNTLNGRLYSNYIQGYSSQTLFALKFAGLDDMGDPQIYLADKSITKTPNVATAKDLEYMGTTQPVLNGGLGNTFSYKGLSLSLNMVYSFGHKMRKDVNTFYNGLVSGGGGLAGQNLNSYFLDRWKQPGDETRTNIPSYVADDFTHYSRRSTMYYTYGNINVVNASYIKLRDITLGYDLQPSALRLLKVQRANIFVQTTNFMVWKANRDNIDPEFIEMRGGGRVVPASRHAYNVGVNVTL